MSRRFSYKKLSLTGDILWTSTYDYEDRATPWDIDALPDGGYIFAGNQGNKTYVVKTNGEGVTSTFTLDMPSTPLKVFPNPADEYAVFEVPSGSMMEGYLERYNSAGQLIGRYVVNGNTYVLDTTSFISGVYTYRLVSDAHSVATGDLIVK